MQTKLIYFAVAVAAGYILAETVKAQRPFGDAYQFGHDQATKA
jgi:hypothetical protein